MRRPVIGISASQFIEKADHGSFTRHSLTKDYSDAVDAAGGVPVILPFYPGHAEAMLDFVDGIILSGGADIDPARFGDDDVHPATYGILAERDETELTLARLAIARDMPVLGICRGLQVLNVAFGGDLYQDVADQLSSALCHRQQANGVPADQPGHTVTATPGSLLERVHDGGLIAVNSFHHQAVKRVAPGLVATGASDDGLVEAIEHPGASFTLGVQWHPELMFKRLPEHLAPFTAIIQACQISATVTR